MARVNQRVTPGTVTPQQQPVSKARHAWLAGLLNLWSGLGYLYSGQPRRAVGALLVLCLILPTLLLLFPVQFPLVLLLVIGLLVWLWTILDAVRWANRASSGYQLQVYNHWGVYLLWALLVVVSGDFVREYIRTYHVQAFKIPSGAMLPTLQIGDRLLVDKSAYKTHEPRRGDLIVFQYPRDPSKNFIMRVGGVAGDTIEIRHKVVYRNGSKVDEPQVTFAYGGQEIPGPRDNLGPLTIPEHKLFVLGDNRDQSHDSRFWGVVDCGKVLGKAKVIYWSWDAGAWHTRWERINQGLE